jgi:hypothetical protein
MTRSSRNESAGHLGDKGTFLLGHPAKGRQGMGEQWEKVVTNTSYDHVASDRNENRHHEYFLFVLL